MSDPKLSALNRKFDAISGPCIGLLSFRYIFEALAECDFVLKVLWLKSLLPSIPKGFQN